jgi:ATP phosphoribosyltransferase regulatory subunit HisZ
MSLFDSVLGQLGGNVDVAGIASSLGIDPQVANTAIAALGQAHGQDGDTVETAAANTGIDAGTLNSLVGALGGHEGLGQIASLVSSNPQLVEGLLGQLGGQGGALGGLAGLAGSFFGGGAKED